MVLCTLFIDINIIPTRQKIHLIWTEHYSEHNVYVFALAGAWTPIAWVRVHHANHYTTKASRKKHYDRDYTTTEITLNISTF